MTIPFDANDKYSTIKWQEAKTAQYWAAVEPALEAHPKSFSREQAKADLEPWLRAQAFSQGPLADALPWLPFAATNLLKGRLNKASRVFEYGTGGSSIFFSA